MSSLPETRSQETVARLKELLFERETRELDTLRVRLAEMQKRAGSDEQFQNTVAAVLDRALKDAETRRHKELTDAMAPMVLRTLRTEMKSPQMQDQISGIMYPRMGEMVARYVASAIRDMMQEINRRLESGLTHSRFFLWLRSLTSGRSMAELALAETQRLEVAEIYLVQRGSGALVHHWRRPGSSGPASGQNRDALVSGFLAAITSLAEEAFEGDKESLRTLDLDDHRIYLRGSPDYLVAAKCSGSAPAGIDRSLDAELIRVLVDQQAIELNGSASGSAERLRDEILGGFAERIEETARERTERASRGGGPLKVLLWLMGLPLAAFVVWSLYITVVTRDLQARANATLVAIPALKGYPLSAHVERGGQRIWVVGLAPDESTRRLVLGRLKQLQPTAELSDALGVLPSSDVEAKLGAEGLRRSVERARRKLASLTANLAAVRERVAIAAEQLPLMAAEEAAKTALAEISAPIDEANSSQIAEAIRGAIEGLRSAADALAGLAGTEVAPPERTAQDATEGADALSIVADRIAVLVATIEQRRAVAPIARRVEVIDESLAARTAEVDRTAEARLAALDRHYQQRLAELEQRLREMQPAPATPRQRMEAFARSNAIFFSNDSEYRDVGAAVAVLSSLAQLIEETGLGVRVVGYTDDIGGPSRNVQLAQSRADRVFADLVARGVPRDKLTAIGRANGNNLAPGAGADSPNRRVEFEPAFIGEKGSRP